MLLNQDLIAFNDDGRIASRPERQAAFTGQWETPELAKAVKAPLSLTSVPARTSTQTGALTSSNTQGQGTLQTGTLTSPNTQGQGTFEATLIQALQNAFSRNPATAQTASPTTTVNVVNPLAQQAAKLPPAQSEAAARAAIAAGNTSFDQPGIRNIDIANIMSDIAAGGNNPLTMSSGELDRIVAAGKPAYERSIADPLMAYNAEFKSFLPRALAAGLSPQQAVEKFGKDKVDYFGTAPRYSSANDAMSQVQGYIAARRAGNAGDMAKYEGRAQLLGINPRDFMGMVEAYAPDLFTEQASSDFYNRYYNPNTRLSDGLPGQLTFEGTSGWNWLKAQKEKYGLTNDQIAYAIGVEPSEVKKYLGMAEGGAVQSHFTGGGALSNYIGG